MNRIDILKYFIKEMEEGRLCCICGAPIEGFGNNPYPCVSIENARCCDECNQNVVIPARIAKFVMREEMTND